MLTINTTRDTIIEDTVQALADTPSFVLPAKLNLKAVIRELEFEGVITTATLEIVGALIKAGVIVNPTKVLVDYSITTTASTTAPDIKLVLSDDSA